MWLDDIRVLEAATLLPVPFATQTMRDLGAEVFKVERPDGGDPARGYPPFTDEGTSRLFAALNAGKGSVAIDLQTEAGRDALASIIPEVDIVIEGFRPGVAGDLGLDASTVHGIDPDIVHCSVSGYGASGPRSSWPGHDLTFAAFAGFLDLSRRSRDERPTIPAFPMADMLGAQFALASVLAALVGSESRTSIDIGLADVLATASLPVATESFDGERPIPGRTALTGALPWYDIYETADGRFVALAALERRFWRDFCVAVDRTVWIDRHGVRSTDERDRLRDDLRALFQTRSLEEWMDLLGGDVPIEGVQSVSDMVAHRQVRARYLLDREQLDRFLPPLQPDSHRRSGGNPPRLGEHTRTILRHAGMDDERIEELVDRAVVVEPD